MKRLFAILCSLAVAACTSVPSAKFSGSPGCQSKTVSANGKSVSTDFCIRKVMFQPSQYLVQVNGLPVFDGTDYERVAFEKQIQAGKVTGGCDANVQIQDMQTNRPVSIATLPQELTSACRISADSNGGALPFKKDVACDKVFYKHLSPMIGKVFPVEISRQCIVRLDNEVIFDGAFRF